MYRGFKLTANSSSSASLITTDHQTLGKKIGREHKEKVKRDFMTYFLKSNYLDGNGIQQEWFPQVQADIFISHSHADSNLAYGIAGWLHEHFRLKCFIDSNIWGYADELLKEIDDACCKNDNDINYNYKKRNLSTSNVHLMLASAISTMIDRTECLFFLNTPSSLSYNNGDSVTESPWLYYEIGQSQQLRRRLPQRELYESQRQFSDGGVIEKSLGFNYKVDMEHLASINMRSLSAWADASSQAGRRHALDILYSQVPPKRTSDQFIG